MLHWKKWCRLCAKPEGGLLDPFAEFTEYYSKNIIELIEAHAKKSIKEMDELPKTVCFTCIGTIKQMEELTQKSLKADKMFNELFQSMEPQTEDFYLEMRKKHDIDDLKHELEIRSENDPFHNDSSIDFSDEFTPDVTPRQTRLGTRKEMKPENFEMTDIKTVLEDSSNESSDDPTWKNITKKQSSKDLKDKSGKLPSQKVKSFGCTICDSFCPNVHQLKKHFKLKHPGAKYPDILKKPKKGHNRPVAGPFICEDCGQVCSSSTRFTEHRATHSNETPYMCSICSKSFKYKRRLFVHMDVHSSGYPCPECGLVLNTKRIRNDHMVVHSDERKYKCDLCDKTFKRHYTRKVHMNTHTNLQKFPCPWCDKIYGSAQNCRTHKKKVHAMEEFLDGNQSDHSTK